MRMNKFAKVGIGALVLAIASVSSAQTNGPTGFSARLGAFFPSDKAGQNLSHTWWGAGVDYKLNSYKVESVNSETPAYLGLSVDYYAHGSDSNVPLALTYNVRAGQFVYSAGLGADFYNVSDLSESGVGLGGQIGVTYEFAQKNATAGSPLFVGAKYFLTKKTALTGLGVYLGVRF